MKKHSLRGSEFENLINNTIDYYREKKLALIQKIPTPIVPLKYDKEKKIINKAYFDKKSTVDYIGVVQEIPVCFDAKESNVDKFIFSNVHKHQFDFMNEFENQGGISFLLIFFKKQSQIYYMRFIELKKYFMKKNFVLIDELNIDYFFKIKSGKINFLSYLQKDLNDR